MGGEDGGARISTTDRVIEGMVEWQSRPAEAVYPAIFIDAVIVKIGDGTVANRPIYIAPAVTVEGTLDILGLWADKHGDGEGWEGEHYEKVRIRVPQGPTQTFFVRRPRAAALLQRADVERFVK